MRRSNLVLPFEDLLFQILVETVRLGVRRRGLQSAQAGEGSCQLVNALRAGKQIT